MLHPSLTNRSASQFNRSGWVGGVPNLPKLLLDRTIPRPKWCCQTRFTATRAVRRLSGLVAHSANAKRRPLVPASVGSGANSNSPNNSGTPGAKASPSAPWALPRASTNVAGIAPGSYVFRHRQRRLPRRQGFAAGLHPF